MTKLCKSPAACPRAGLRPRAFVLPARQEKRAGRERDTRRRHRTPCVDAAGDTCCSCVARLSRHQYHIRGPPNPWPPPCALPTGAHVPGGPPPPSPGAPPTPSAMLSPPSPIAALCCTAMRPRPFSSAWLGGWCACCCCCACSCDCSRACASCSNPEVSANTPAAATRAKRAILASGPCTEPMGESARQPLRVRARHAGACAQRPAHREREAPGCGYPPLCTLALDWALS
jgi:hypothetical protein